MAAGGSSEKRVLLSTAVAPQHYDITFEVDLVSCEFFGSVQVAVEVREETSVIELYAVDLEFSEGSVSYNGQAASKIEQLPEQDGLLRVHFATPLSKTAAGTTGQLLFAKYKGLLNDRMEGFYRSQYTHSSGEKRYMGVTQFEATDARRAFPCWDEPAVKSTFSITITADKTLSIISNMPESSRTELADGKRVQVAFEKTPKMSTYLVAWVIGEFSSVHGTSKRGTKMGVFTPHGKSEQGLFALDAACRVLDYFEDYYDIPYQLPKLDCLAIPDFSAGAMENWGCVTYRETALLIAPDASVAAKQRVAYVVAHELAHQWFGNLVTMEWWRELWLNEGFATYAGQAAVAHCYPQWDMWTAFFSDYVAGALRLDGLRSSHPIEVEVHTSAQIDEIFDAISYSKGASVIRMCAQTIGEEAFRDGLRIYLKRHQFGNAVTTDLWQALSETSGINVTELMANWVLITGYPILSVEQQSSGDKHKLLISQKRFLADGSEADEKTLWSMVLNIEVCWPSGDKQLFQARLNNTSSSVEVELGGQQPRWVVVNSGQSVVCRVGYSTALSSALSRALANGEITNPVDRLGLVNDAFALAKAGFIRTSAFLNLVQGYAKEDNFRVLSVLSGSLEALRRVWSQDAASLLSFDHLIGATFYPLLRKLTWDKKEGEREEDALSRALLISLLVSAKHPEVLQHAQSLFSAQLEGGRLHIENIPSDIRGAIFQSWVLSGNSEALDHLLNIFRREDIAHTERLKALVAAAGTPDAAQLDRMLALSISDEIRPQDSFYIFSGLESIEASQRAWRFVKENWLEIEKKFRGALISRIITGSFARCLGQEIIDDVRAFFEKHPCPPAARAIDQTIESIQVNTKWLASQSADVHTFCADLTIPATSDIQ